ncbi:GNAT family N-acetyltransferase [Halosaccharopolyspora lacisalsi]|uniref:GNAT family N-acetyltransferase n=1 Tax=Halosaccharopolyspora lacisalsi TaxID=1000566 RepID=UPI0015FCE0E2|nr:GNAT family N-acetyltransferase [Halosaccharopolyspora lacisalsi]
MLTEDVDVDIAPFDLQDRLDEVRALARTAMTDAGQPGGILVAKYLDEVTELDGLLALGAHRGQRLVGMLVGWPTASREWWPHHVRPALTATHNEHWLDDAFELAELHVHPDVQRHGLASALLDEVRLRIDQPRIVLGTNALNNQRARQFYRGQGFRTLTGPFEWLGLDMRIFVLGLEFSGSSRG